MEFSVRKATKEDCKEISRMIMEMAVFIKSPDQVKISHRELERDCFCENPLFECLVAVVPEEHKSKEGCTVVGYAFYFHTYSTWKGRTMFLEDLYVMPEFRGKGIGKSLLSNVAKLDYPEVVQVVKEKQCARLQLCVLDWNTPARQLYTSKGAQDLTDVEGCHFMRLDGRGLDGLAEEASKNVP